MSKELYYYYMWLYITYIYMKMSGYDVPYYLLPLNEQEVNSHLTSFLLQNNFQVVHLFHNIICQ